VQYTTHTRQIVECVLRSSVIGEEDAAYIESNGSSLSSDRTPDASDGIFGQMLTWVLLNEFKVYLSDINFKFGTQLGFAKARHKITCKRKSGRGPGLSELPKIWWFHLDINSMAEATDFKFATQLRFAKAHHKITPRGKSGRGLGLGKHPYIRGFPLIFLQRPRCPLSISGASCYSE